jgi:hypothetical protein
MAGDGDLKLLGMVVSPFVVRVRMALHLKGVSYEYMEQDLFNKGEPLHPPRRPPRARRRSLLGRLRRRQGLQHTISQALSCSLDLSTASRC